MQKVIGGILLITGTCIGAGMLGLPVTSAASGFYYSLVLLFLCWVFMYLTGLCVLEVNLTLQHDVSYISMARTTLGRAGGIVTWVFFLLLLYSLLAAYVTGGGNLLAQLLSKVSHKLIIPVWVGSTLWTVGFACIVFVGVAWTDFINRFFMLGLLAAYALLLVIGMPHVSVHALDQGKAIYLFAAIPIVFTTLAFHIIIPTIVNYLEGKAKQLKQILLWGSLLPLAIYIVWEFIIFSILPLHGSTGLITILKAGNAASAIPTALYLALGSPVILYAAEFFVFFAVASSFLGVAYGLFDLIADGLKIEKTLGGRFIVALYTFIPPIIFSAVYPKGFILALTYAGIFVAIVHGVLPVLMVWCARYTKKVIQVRYVPGGKTLLVIVMLFFIAVICIDIAANLHWIPVISD